MVKKILVVCCLATLLLLGLAISGSILGVPNTVTTTNINSSASGVRLVIQASSGQAIYVTHYHVFFNGSTNFSWVYGTQSTSPCDTGQTVVDGPMAFVAQTGISAGTGLGSVINIPASQQLCINSDQAIQIGGAVSWTYGSP